jgi:putative transposase
VLAASPFHGEGHRKVWARLRYAGTRTSMRRVCQRRREDASVDRSKNASRWAASWSTAFQFD